MADAVCAEGRAACLPSKFCIIASRAAGVRLSIASSNGLARLRR